MKSQNRYLKHIPQERAENTSMNNVNSLKEIEKSLDKDTKKRIKKMRKYICPHYEELMIALVAFPIAVMFIAEAVIEMKGLTALGIFVFLCVLYVGLIYSSIRKTRAYCSIIAEHMTLGGVNTLLSDFENGGKAFKGSMILGQQNIYGKRSGEIIPYSSVVRIYQYIEKDGIFENDRKICLELKNDKKLMMGNIPLRGKGNEELRQVFGYICSRNENVMVGYAG